METIGERLASWRKRAGLTQMQVAVRIGTTPTNVSRYERGERDPSRHVIAELAELYGVGPAERWEAVALPVVAESGR